MLLGLVEHGLLVVIHPRVGVDVVVGSGLTMGPRCTWGMSLFAFPYLTSMTVVSSMVHQRMMRHSTAYAMSVAHEGGTPQPRAGYGEHCHLEG